MILGQDLLNRGILVLKIVQSIDWYMIIVIEYGHMLIFPLNNSDFKEFVFKEKRGYLVKWPCDAQATIIFIEFWGFLMSYQVFISPQAKRCAIITYKHGTT